MTGSTPIEGPSGERSGGALVPVTRAVPAVVQRGPRHLRDDGPAVVDAPVLAATRRWLDRPVLVVGGASFGVLVAAALTLVLLPHPPQRQPTALPPAIPAPARTTPPTSAPSPSATDGFTPASGAHTVSTHALKPSPPPPPPPAGPPRLAALPPSREGELRSVTARRETAIEFVNARDEPVVVYWLDYGGDRVRYRILGPRDSYRQHTFVTHPWVVTRWDGRGLAVFLPLAEPARATVT